MTNQLTKGMANLLALNITTPALLEEYVCEGTVNGVAQDFYPYCEFPYVNKVSLPKPGSGAVEMGVLRLELGERPCAVRGRQLCAAKALIADERRGVAHEAESLGGEPSLPSLVTSDDDITSEECDVPRPLRNMDSTNTACFLSYRVGAMTAKSASKTLSWATAP